MSQCLQRQTPERTYSVVLSGAECYWGVVLSVIGVLSDVSGAK